MVRCRLVRIVALLILALSVSSSMSQHTFAADQRCFSETGQCLSGRFRSY